MSDFTLAVAGATGVLGRQLVDALVRRDFDPEALRLSASAESEGELVDCGGKELEVERVGPQALDGVDVAVLALPAEVAGPLAHEAARRGLWCVDLSSAFRLDLAVPVFAPGLGEAALDAPLPGRTVAVAGPATQALVSVLEPLRSAFGVGAVELTLLQGAAAQGRRGIERLTQQTAALLNAREPELGDVPHRLAFNLVPGGGDFRLGLSAAEVAVQAELARLYPPELRPSLGVTAVSVPTYHGALLVVAAQLRRRVEADAVREVLRAARGLKVLDAVEEHVYPTPLLVIDDPAVHVGRVRVQGDRLQLVAAVDGACRAAETALDVAFRLAERD